MPSGSWPRRTSPTTSLANLSHHEDSAKRFIRGSKNSSIHQLEFAEKEEDEDEPVTQFARFAPASTSSSEKIPAPYIGLYGGSIRAFSRSTAGVQRSVWSWRTTSARLFKRTRPSPSPKKRTTRRLGEM